MRHSRRTAPRTLRPPSDTFFDCLEARPFAGIIGFAEHDVIGARFRRGHGVMAGSQMADAGNAFGLELLERGCEGRNAAQMRAVGARPRRHIGMAAEQQRGASVLHDGPKRLGAVDLGALVGLGEAQQYGGDVAGRHGRRQDVGKCLCVGDRRRHQIKTRRRAWLGLYGSRTHGPRMLAQSGGKLTRQMHTLALPARALEKRPCVRKLRGGPMLKRLSMLMLSLLPVFAIAPALAPDGDFDVNKFFAPITVVAAPPYLLVVNPKVEANSVAELIKLAGTKPKALSFGSSGIGAASHLSGALFEKDAHVEMLHVPYKGTGPAVTDLLGGRIDMMFSPSTTVQQFVASGQLKAIATTGAKRSKFSPTVPTVAESGLPGYESTGWFGLLAPAHTPPEIVTKLNKAVVAIMAEKDVIDHMAKLGAEPEPQTPEEFGRYINADVAKWSKLVKEENIVIPGAGK